MKGNGGGDIIGVLGAGQLGRMLALAGIPLGLRFRFLDPNPDSPAREVGDLLVAEYEDDEQLARFARGLTCVTYEFENVPVEPAAVLAGMIPLAPGVRALEAAQDRIDEKRLFDSLKIPTPRYAAVESAADLDRQLQDGFPLPAVLKTRRMGYDGKGQRVIREVAEAAAAFRDLGEVPAILEAFVNFEGELSLIGARNSRAAVFYPLIQNIHVDGILDTSEVPAPLGSAALQTQAERYMHAVMEALDYRGVLTIEFFLSGGQLIANEMAPRVHNSGHWTIEGAETSQFENHLRAVLDLPLGPTVPVGRVRMKNIIGVPPDRAAILEHPGAHLHLYGKAPRAKRKLGHVTFIG